MTRKIDMKDIQKLADEFKFDHMILFATTGDMIHLVTYGCGADNYLGLYRIELIDDISEKERVLFSEILDLCLGCYKTRNGDKNGNTK